MGSSSALVDLQAELSRKENELQEARMTRSSGKGKGDKTFAKIQEITSGKKKKCKNSQGKCKEVKDNETSDETLQLLEQARRKLEAKSKIYDKMQKGEMEDVENIYGETKYLVDFQHKYYTEVDDEEKWLNESFSDSRLTLDSQTPNNSKNSSLLFEVGELHREQMREKWEREQEELLNGPVHYENVKFDEIRDLGTGYFAFSKDEEELKKQMEEFQNLRNETKTAQSKKEILKGKRKAALQERLDKIKIRKYGSAETGEVVLSHFNSEHSSHGEGTSFDNDVKTCDEVSTKEMDGPENCVVTKRRRNIEFMSERYTKGKRVG